MVEWLLEGDGGNDWRDGYGGGTLTFPWPPSAQLTAPAAATPYMLVE